MEFRQHLEEIKAMRADDPEPERFFPEPAKRAINEVLFEIMPPGTTLRDVEDLAVAIFLTVEGAWSQHAPAVG